MFCRSCVIWKICRLNLTFQEFENESVLAYESHSFICSRSPVWVTTVQPGLIAESPENGSRIAHESSESGSWITCESPEWFLIHSWITRVVPESLANSLRVVPESLAIHPSGSWITCESLESGYQITNHQSGSWITHKWPEWFLNHESPEWFLNHSRITRVVQESRITRVVPESLTNHQSGSRITHDSPEWFLNHSRITWEWFQNHLWITCKWFQNCSRSLITSVTKITCECSHSPVVPESLMNRLIVFPNSNLALPKNCILRCTYASIHLWLTANWLLVYFLFFYFIFGWPCLRSFYESM